MVQPGGKKYADRVVDAVTQAFYARATSSPDTARARAQSAYGIASAVAGGLLGGALIANLSSLSIWVQAVGALALFAWLVAISLYIYAVAVPVSLDPTQQDPQGADAFIEAVVTNAVSERKSIDERQLNANKAAAVAILLTAAAFGYGIFASADESFPATIFISSNDKSAAVLSCSPGTGMISGQVYKNSLDKAFIRIRPDPKICSRPVAVVYVRASAIVRIEDVTEAQ